MIEPTPLSDWKPSARKSPLIYPGRIPESAFVLEGGFVHEMEASDFLTATRELDIGLDDRIAVLASGSNASPAALAEKCGDDAIVPVARVEVANTAVVYSAHITRYGSIPATRIDHPGSRTFVHVPLFDPGQLAAVDATEGSYARELLNDGLPAFLGPVWSYQSWRGQLEPAGQPICLAEVPATSELLAATQIEALSIVAAMTGAAPDGRTLSELVASGQVDADDVNRLLGEC